jgi:hypothetical protein
MLFLLSGSLHGQKPGAGRFVKGWPGVAYDPSQGETIVHAVSYEQALGGAEAARFRSDGVGLVVSPVNNTLQAFSAQAGAWTTLSAVVQDTGAIALGGRVAGMDNN